MFASFVFGAISALALAPISFVPALFAGLSGFYALLRIIKRKSHGFFIGFFYFCGYFGFGFYWIGNALLVEGNDYWWAWPLAVTGLPIMLALFGAIASYIYVKLYTPQNWHGLLGFIMCISLAEWCRGNLFTGFPWNLFGYSWSASLPMMQVVSFSGIYTLSALTVFWAASIGFLFVSRDRKIIKACVAFISVSSFLGCYIYGYGRVEGAQTEYNKDYRLVLVQPNIQQSQKWNPQEIVVNYYSMLGLSRNNDVATQDPAPKATYIVWAETAFPYGLLNNQQYKQALINMLQSYPEEAYLVSGTLRYEEKTDSYYNSIVLIDKNGVAIETYDKNHLVPFGEYMPLDEYLDISPIVGFKGFDSGDGYRILSTPEGVKILPLVCYEIIFPEVLPRPYTKELDVVINVTNDAWYGISAGPYQHLAQASFRAVELGAPVVRVANTGISAVIDANGRILQSIPLGEKNKLVSFLPRKSVKISENYFNMQFWSMVFCFFTCVLAVFERKKYFTNDD